MWMLVTLKSEQRKQEKFKPNSIFLAKLAFFIDDSVTDYHGSISGR